MQPTNLIAEIIASLPFPPTLVDVGASGDPPEIWKEVAHLCNYVAFDPDTREFSELRSSGFRRSIIINKAVTPVSADTSLVVYLTKSPYCSSTLKPAKDCLDNYLFADLFSVEEVVTVPCIDLAAAIENAKLEMIDWVKIDTQGTDLRIWKSLPQSLRRDVLAVDVEPGIINAYESEDFFVDTHKALVDEGLWLSNLCIGSATRMRPATADRLDRSLAEALAKLQRPSPAWAEARYLRSIEWLDQVNADAGRCRLLMAFALMDAQYGFALDIVDYYRRKFGDNGSIRRMGQQLQDWLLANADTPDPLFRPDLWRTVRNVLRKFIS